MASSNLQSRNTGYRAELDDAERASRDESFQAFTRRHEIPALADMFAAAA